MIFYLINKNRKNIVFTKLIHLFQEANTQVQYTKILSFGSQSPQHP